MCGELSVLAQEGPIPFDREFETLLDRDLGAPSEQFASAGAVAVHAPDLRWAIGQRSDLDLGFGIRQLGDLEHQIADSDFLARAQVDHALDALVRARRQDHPLDQILDEVELPRLLAERGSDWPARKARPDQFGDD